MPIANKLAQMFNDPEYAWKLLEFEILIETSQVPDGLHIAELLQLYMRGVEVMNTTMDPRESYFKNKVTSLMGKNTVMKSFKQAPKNEDAHSTPVKPKNGYDKPKEGLISSGALKQKKKELELRLAYANQEHDHQSLRKMMASTRQTEIKVNRKITNLLKNHDEALNERIHRRRLRSSTYRSRTEDQTDSLQEMIEQDSPTHENGKGHSNLVTTTSLKKLPEAIPELPQKQREQKRYRSAEGRQGGKVDNQWIDVLQLKRRKLTADLADISRQQ